MTAGVSGRKVWRGDTASFDRRRGSIIEGWIQGQSKGKLGGAGMLLLAIKLVLMRNETPPLAKFNLTQTLKRCPHSAICV